MRLPDADGFIVAAQKLLDNGGAPLDVVYLHDAEGAPCAVLVTVNAWQTPWETKNRQPLERHGHLEADEGEEVPWRDKG